MTEAASNVSTGSVTFAARDSEFDSKPIKQGQIMGLAEGKIRFIDDSDVVKVAYDTTMSLFTDEKSLVTIIYGEGATEEQAQQLEEKLKEELGSDAEITIIEGGQPIYYFIVSVE